MGYWHENLNVATDFRYIFGHARYAYERYYRFSWT